MIWWSGERACFLLQINVILFANLFFKNIGRIKKVFVYSYFVVDGRMTIDTSGESAWHALRTNITIFVMFCFLKPKADCSGFVLVMLLKLSLLCSWQQNSNWHIRWKDMTLIGQLKYFRPNVWTIIPFGYSCFIIESRTVISISA